MDTTHPPAGIPRWTREDVAAVPLQDERVAARCPVRVQFDAAPPGRPTPPSAAADRRRRAEREFVSDALSRLLGSVPGAVAVAADPTDPDGAVKGTLAALAGGAPVVVLPRLPADPSSRRTGSPDALVAAPGGGHHPVVVRSGRTLTPAARGGARCSPLATPGLAHAVDSPGHSARRRRDAHLALAHHHRLLEACGHAASEPWGAVLGPEGELVWQDLTAPVWRTPSRSRGEARRGALEVHDFELAFRLDVVAAAQRGDRRVVPVRTRECGSCPWWGHCGRVLEEEDHVSLLPGSTWPRWVAHRDRGVHTVADLALREPDDPAYDGSPVEIGPAVHAARARRSPWPVVRRRPEPVPVPRADVEVDIDLENVETGVYLWGALVTDRSSSRAPVTTGYRSFVTWEADPAGAEVAVFEEFCAWLDEVRRAARSADATLAVYCFNERAEAGAMRRLAGLPGAAPARAGWVEELVGSTEWVDLYRVARDHLLTGTSMGLKYLAGAAGFSWEDEDPGGEQSMEWHGLAVGAPDPAERAANRNRLLTYNRNDTEATLALREWLAREGDRLPSVTALGPTGHPSNTVAACTRDRPGTEGPDAGAHGGSSRSSRRPSR